VVQDAARAVGFTGLADAATVEDEEVREEGSLCFGYHLKTFSTFLPATGSRRPRGHHTLSGHEHLRRVEHDRARTPGRCVHGPVAQPDHLPMESGSPRKSVRTRYRSSEKDRCDEDAHRLLMGCFVRLGQRARRCASTGCAKGHSGRSTTCRPAPKPWTLYASVPKNRDTR
jgi:hypothetical protein